MTMQSRSNRYYWRRRTRRLMYLSNALLAAMLLLASTGSASAQTRWDRCYEIPHGTVCVARAAKVTRITCDWGWQPQFGRTPRCIALEVQP